MGRPPCVVGTVYVLCNNCRYSDEFNACPVYDFNGRGPILVVGIAKDGELIWWADGMYARRE